MSDRDSQDMNVVHLTPNVFAKDRGFVGGAERYVLEMARHMAEQTPTRLIAFEECPRTTSEGCLEIRTLKPACYVGSKWNPFSLSMLRELKWADVVHCHQYKTCIASTAAVYARLTGRRVFASDLGGAGRDVSSYISTDRWYHGHLHLSSYSRSLAGHNQCPYAHVIYGGVALDRFSPDPAVERNGSVLFVGRLLPHKGVDVLIQALPRDMRLIVVGQEANPSYLKLLHKLATGKDVVFVHNADDSRLLSHYRQSLCIVLPSVHRTVFGDETLYPELLGQTLLEGMACDALGLCSDAASLPEIVRDGETGFIVPWGNVEALNERLAWLRDHPADVRRMGRTAGEDVRARFNWKTVTARCLSIYGVTSGRSLQIHP